MNSQQPLPSFDDCFSDLNQFILDLVQAHKAGKIKSWDELEERVNDYFGPAKMQQMEILVPGWQKMASYSGGITLVHVMCVFLGLFMLPEFQQLNAEQKQLAKWVILLHDVDKFHIRGKKDTMHAFRSGVHAAKLLPGYGFATSQEYPALINSWGDQTVRAFLGDAEINPKPDNQKLPEILTGIDRLYGSGSPAGLIVKTVLLHISLHVDPFYPTPAALTRDEIKRYIDPALFPLLRAMMLSDNEGWSLFDPVTRLRQRNDTLKAFEEVEKII